MTTGDERAAVLEQLEAALRADTRDAKNFHIREAIQFLYIEREPAQATSDGTDEIETK